MLKLHCVTVLACSIIVFFPIAGSDLKQKMKKNEYDTRSGDDVVTKKEFGQNFSDFPVALKHLLLNRTFMLFTLGMSIDNFLINGFITFFPKFLEHQFSMTASEASFYGGTDKILHVPTQVQKKYFCIFGNGNLT